MLREWLPHLLTGIVALSFAASGATYLAMSETDQHAVEKKWSGWLTPNDKNTTDNQTLVARLPPDPYMVWGSLAFAAIGGFYVAAAASGYVHRTEE